MSTYTLTCKNIRQNNGIQQAHLQEDLRIGGQPTEVLWNGTAAEFVRDAGYLVSITRLMRPLTPTEN
jgi:hypothetical protein